MLIYDLKRERNVFVYMFCFVVEVVVVVVFFSTSIPVTFIRGRGGVGGGGTPYFEKSEPGGILGMGKHRFFFPFSHNAEPGPRLILFIIRSYTVTNLATWNLKHPIFGFSLDHS